LIVQTDDLIETLSAQLQPVRRMRAPALRALGWLGAIGVLGCLLIWRYADMPVFMDRIAVPRTALEVLGSTLTAIAAVIAAFELSIPGRSRRWRWLPLAPFLLWLGASGLGCLANGIGLRAQQPPPVESAHCFMFIAAVSLPLALALFWMLRQARPIDPLPVATFGTLGVAAMAATLLQFFHPFDVTVIDLTFHLAAIGLVILIGTALRGPLLASRYTR
jgi:hypothetical protein